MSGQFIQLGPVPTDGDFFQVSGNTTITAVGVASAGVRFRAMFTGAGLNLRWRSTLLHSNTREKE